MLHEIRELYNTVAKLYIRYVIKKAEPETQVMLPSLERMVTCIIGEYSHRYNREVNRKKPLIEPDELPF